MVDIKKLILIIMLFPTIILSLNITVYAVDDENEDTLSEVYDEQLELSGAGELFDSLPEQTKKLLSDMGVASADYEAVTSLNITAVFEEIISLAGTSGSGILTGAAACLGIMLLLSLTECFKVSIGEKAIGNAASAIAAVCVCTAIVAPMCNTIEEAEEVLNGASGFLLLYVPIMAGLMVSSGKEISGASYYTVMMAAGEVVSQISSKLIIPLMNVFLALSVTSSISPKLKFNTLCTSVYNISKWVLTFIMSVFVTLLSVQTIVTSSLDNVSSKAIRFAINSFVPVVGSALSEALSTFSGSIELLKSGAGVFVIIASSFVFLPIIIECIVWRCSLFFLASAAELLGLSQMSGLFKMISKAAAILLAVLLCVMTIFIISTVIILLIGK